MLAFGLLNLIGSLDQTGMYDTPLYPTTSQMLGAIQDSYTWLLMIIVMFYAGELVWRERIGQARRRHRCVPGAELGAAAGQGHGPGRGRRRVHGGRRTVVHVGHQLVAGLHRSSSRCCT